MKEKEFLNKVIDLLQVMSVELKIKEKECIDGRMLIRIGHRISSIHKVKHYIKQRIKGEGIPPILRKGDSNDILYNLKYDDKLNK
tara:strand:- start:915 stop:1169 length:255 start_codon:yes stop_codon:yes gene_type:complete